MCLLSFKSTHAQQAKLNRLWVLNITKVVRAIEALSLAAIKHQEWYWTSTHEPGKQASYLAALERFQEHLKKRS